jgi:hypothetical protein
MKLTLRLDHDRLVEFIKEGLKHEGLAVTTPLVFCVTGAVDGTNRLEAECEVCTTASPQFP